QDVLSRTTKFRISDNDLKRYANSSLEELRKTKTDLQKYERSHHGWIVSQAKSRIARQTKQELERAEKDIDRLIKMNLKV
ncbi:MAG: hypothetical protein V1731_00095, partial [Candidatus Aenigmatarchaeota archaeon]